MQKVFAIDPGNVQSAYVIWDGKRIIDKGKILNVELLYKINDFFPSGYEFVAEKIACYGMPVGKEIFETVFWTGRFCQAWKGVGFHRVTRGDVKMHLCHSMKARDSNIRRALIDRFEPDLPTRKLPKGILKGVSADIWAALAVAVYFYDTKMKEK